MSRLASGARPWLLVLISCMSVVVAAALLYWRLGTISRSTIALAVLLGLFVLPVATLGVVRLDRRARRAVEPQ